MAHIVKHILLAMGVCFAGQPWSTALAQDGGSLVLPAAAGDPVELLLQSLPLEGSEARHLRVFVGSPDMCCEGKTPIAGTYAIDGRTLTFDPAFDFIAGQTYTVQSHEQTINLSSFTIALAGDASASGVVAIYPSGAEIPENTLRFYIEFSSPMMPHRAGDFIKLVNSEGVEDAAAFMLFTQELWNEDRTRLTLLMDPGRIKRGVAQNVALGPALLEGERYSIVVEGGWPRARGELSAPGFEKTFTVSSALRTLPDTDSWKVQPPTVATKEPVIITFDRPFDRQLAQNAIMVRDAQGQPILGTTSVESHETSWRFEPEEPWAARTIHVVVDPHLEDVAGNNFIDLLDHALGTDQQAAAQQVISIDLLKGH
ncbi:MAG: hypothetical protein AAF737_00690 [Pseudomonadota bacterium]